MFQFSGFASLAGYPIFNRVGCPIRTSGNQGLFAPLPGFSQLITSFIASESLGIRHALLLTFLYTQFYSVYYSYFQYVKELIFN